MTNCDVCKENFDEQERTIRESDLPDGSKYLAFVCKDCLPSKEEEI